MAGVVANELGVHLHITSGPALERAGDLAAILTKLDEGDVLFIDEIHRLGRPVEEILYPAMEDFQLDIVVGKGPAASSIRLPLPRFTMVGATTRTGMITGPLRDRFGFVARLDYYTAAELEAIVMRAATILGVPIDADGAIEIAGRARGTPRIANRLLRRVRDFAEVRGDGAIDRATASEGLALFGVDGLGLDKVDRAILRTICERFGGGPVGLSTLAISVGEQPETVEDVYEPFLMQQGLLQRTPRGRVASSGGVPAPRARRPGRGAPGGAVRQLRAGSSGRAQAGRWVARNSAVIAHAAFAASASKNIGASWLSNAWPASWTWTGASSRPSNVTLDLLHLLERDVCVALTEMEDDRTGHVARQVERRRDVRPVVRDRHAGLGARAT